MVNSNLEGHSFFYGYIYYAFSTSEVRIMSQQNMYEALSVPKNKREYRFEEFHKKYPIVYDLWDKFTREAIDRGMSKIGAALIMERIRWETSIKIEDARPDGKAVKINDHYKAYYSRLWMLKNPIHKGIFNTRKVEGDNE